MRAPQPASDQDLDEVLEYLLHAEARLRREESDQFKLALSTSRQIGMAIGFLMGRHALTEEQAFAALVRTSRDGNRKLRDVAAEVLGQRALPAARQPQSD